MNARSITLCIKKSASPSFPVDTGRKFNVGKTLRSRSGDLLNVLCTFNLPPVSPDLKRDVLVFVKYLYFYFYLQTVQLKKKFLYFSKAETSKNFLIFV